MPVAAHRRQAPGVGSGAEYRETRLCLQELQPDTRSCQVHLPVTSGMTHFSPPPQHSLQHSMPAWDEGSVDQTPALKCTSRGTRGSLLSTSLLPHLAHRDGNSTCLTCSLAARTKGISHTTDSVCCTVNAFCTSVSPVSNSLTRPPHLVAHTPYVPTTCPGPHLPTGLCTCSPS